MLFTCIRRINLKDALIFSLQIRNLHPFNKDTTCFLLQSPFVALSFSWRQFWITSDPARITSGWNLWKFFNQDVDSSFGVSISRKSHVWCIAQFFWWIWIAFIDPKRPWGQDRDTENKILYAFLFVICRILAMFFTEKTFSFTANKYLHTSKYITINKKTSNQTGWISLFEPEKIMEPPNDPYSSDFGLMNYIVEFLFYFIGWSKMLPITSSIYR